MRSRGPRVRMLCDGRRVCGDCGEAFSLDGFYARYKNGVKHWDGKCHSCRKVAMIARNLCISTDQYRAMLARTQGKCEICADSERLVVDHCHSTGKIRGMLCQRCNVALGGFRDDVEVMRRAIEYIQSHAAAEMTEEEKAVGQERERRMKKIRDCFKNRAAKENHETPQLLWDSGHTAVA